MACGLSNTNSSFLKSLSSQNHPTTSVFKPPLCLKVNSFWKIGGSLDRQSINRKPFSTVVVSASHCGEQFGSYNNNNNNNNNTFNSSLNMPLEPKSTVGKSLSGVLFNFPQAFYDAVSIELSRVASDRDDAIARMDLSLGSPESGLHRRIAELKERECGAAIEDSMYIIIFQKFSQIRVPLVPRLSECIYNGRLEILPAKHGELESIHTPEVKEMIREHLKIVIGWKSGSSVKDNWTPIQVQRLQLSRVYASSILFGYFLKSASLRHKLERSLHEANKDMTCNWMQLSEIEGSYGLKNLVFDQFRTPRSTTLSQASILQSYRQKKLMCYVEGFDAETLAACATLKSQEAANLVEKHCLALFGDGKSNCIQADGEITTSLSSLKRLVLEAIAFGSFLWDAEECIDRVYKLKN